MSDHVIKLTKDKGFYMIYLKWACFALISILINLLSILLSPVIALYSIATNNPTPKVFAWFYTHDDDLDGNHPIYQPKPTNLFKLWWYRTCWISRNPGYGFAATVVGLKVADVTCTTIAFANGWTDTFRRNGNIVGFGYSRITDGYNIWLGWAAPSHDGKYYMLKTKFKRR